MKFANYYFEGSQLNNLGDNLQLLAIDYIYQQMGIPKNDLIQISKHDLAIYDGEYAILPVSMPLVDYVENGLAGRFSPKIIPVFLGLTLLRDFLLPEEVQYLSQYAPVGCRDERTMQTLHRHNVPAYLNGCITALLPNAGIDRSNLTKVFLVDIPSELEPYIPAHLLENAQRETHLKKGASKQAKQMATDQYEMYKNEAALVITSLLHCSSPCMAAGIPVVLAKTACSYRFGWLEKLLPIYTREDFPNIDWAPTPVHYEEHKQALLQNAMACIRWAQQNHEQKYTISAFYEDRAKKPYIVDTFESIKAKINSLWSKDKPVKYAVWGLTQLAEQVVHYVKQNYPLAQLAHVYDKNRRLAFDGIMPEDPEALVNRPEEFIVVTAVAATEEAMLLFEKIGLPEDMYAFGEIVV